MKCKVECYKVLQDGFFIEDDESGIVVFDGGQYIFTYNNNHMNWPMVFKDGEWYDVVYDELEDAGLIEKVPGFEKEEITIESINTYTGGMIEFKLSNGLSILGLQSLFDTDDTPFFLYKGTFGVNVEETIVPEGIEKEFYRHLYDVCKYEYMNNRDRYEVNHR